jgi:hypothetical protein
MGDSPNVCAIALYEAHRYSSYLTGNTSSPVNGVKGIILKDLKSKQPTRNKMAELRSFETSVNLYQITRCHIPDTAEIQRTRDSVWDLIFLRSLLKHYCLSGCDAVYFCLFNDAVSNSGYIASIGEMISEWWIGKDVEGSGCGLILGYCSGSCLGENTIENLTTVASRPRFKPGTSRITSQKRQCLM